MLTPTVWINQAYDAGFNGDFTAKAVSAITHSTLDVAREAIAHALTQQHLAPSYHWVCPQCSHTLAISATLTPIPPNLPETCERCDLEFDEIPTESWEFCRFTYYRVATASV